MPLTPYELIRLKLTSFFFNTRADALRGEMFRALCLLVIGIDDAGLSFDEIVDKIIVTLGSDNGSKSSIRPIVSDELRTLESREEIYKNENDLYKISASNILPIPNEKSQDELIEVLSSELIKVVSEISPGLSSAQQNKIRDFYFEIVNVIANQQLPFVTRGQSPDVSDEFAMTKTVSESRIKYGLDEFINFDKFIEKTILSPPPTLKNFLYKLFQVTVAIQLMSWDPTLEYLQNQILSDKTLFLDSSILFAIMQSTHPYHEFISGLLLASKNDLDTQIEVHEETVREYQRSIDWANHNFSNYKQTLIQLSQNSVRDQKDLS